MESSWNDENELGQKVSSVLFYYSTIAIVN